MTATAPADVRFGANYVPSAHWFHSWLDFDPDAVRRDFADLAGIGLDHVRVFPIWPWIQPNRGLIRQRPIDDLLTTIDLAAEAGLEVAVDLLQGHMSSFDFLPSWTLTFHRASLFGDSRIRAGIAQYVDTVSAAVGRHDNVFAITLGNEVNNLWPAYDATPADTRDFAEGLLTIVADRAPGKLPLYSVFDAAWYHPDHPFHPRDATELGALSTVHSWVFNGVSDLDGPLGPATVSHADYLVELAAATATDPDRPVWLQEVGVPRPDVPPVDAAAFVRHTLTHTAGNPALWGVTWWCSHDIDRALLDFPDREYDLGLFTVDHQAKPAATALAEHIARYRRGELAPAPAGTGLVCPIDPATEPERRAEIAPGSPFHTAWVRRRSSGRVAIIPAHRAGNADYLAARGIQDVATLD